MLVRHGYRGNVPYPRVLEQAPRLERPGFPRDTWFGSRELVHAYCKSLPDVLAHWDEMPSKLLAFKTKKGPTKMRKDAMMRKCAKPCRTAAIIK